MTTDTTFTTDEKKTLTNAVMLSGMAVSMADLGVFSTVAEATALGQEIAGAAKAHPNNAIIQSLFSEEAVKQARETGTLKMDVASEEMRPETAMNTAIAHVNNALTILSAKASPEETQEFKNFIYHCAERVANAAGSGLFGSGKTKVSQDEAVALGQLKTALGI